MKKEISLKDLQNVDSTQDSYDDDLGIMAKAAHKRHSRDVEEDVQQDRYKRVHGKNASGKAKWIFTTKRFGDVDYDNEKEFYQHPKFDSLAVAAKAAMKALKSRSVYVMESTHQPENNQAFVVYEFASKKEYAVETYSDAQKIASRLEHSHIYNRDWWNENYITEIEQLNEYYVGDIRNSIAEGKQLSFAQTELLRTEYNKINKIDPSSKAYKDLIKLLNGMNKQDLQRLVDAKIKFVSALALNRINRATEEVETQDLEEALTIAQRIKRRAIMRQNKSKIKLGIRRAKRRRPTRAVYIRRAKRAARNLLFKKFTSGKKKDELSYSDRIRIEKRLAARKAVIERLARKLLPIIIKKDKLKRAAAEKKKAEQ